MSWFGFGGKKEPAGRSSSGGGDGFGDDSSFAPADFGPDLGSGSVGGSRGGGGGTMLSQAAIGGLQEQLEAEQQKIQIQQVIARLTELAFESCVEKPSTSLSSSEERCIRGAVFKYLDTGEFVVGRFAKSRGPGH